MELRESVHRIHQSEEIFGRRFYAYFLDRYPKAREFFANTNMERQSIVFTMQLAVIEAFHSNGTPTAAQYLQVLGTMHQERGIPRELYDGFRDCLIHMLAEVHGDQWDDALEAEWRRAIDGSIEKILEGYERRYHV